MRILPMETLSMECFSGTLGNCLDFYAQKKKKKKKSPETNKKSPVITAVEGLPLLCRCTQVTDLSAGAVY